MRYLVLNGNPEPSPFDGYLDGFGRGLREAGHEVERLDLRELSLAYCSGCWSCWWATPGRCAIKDEIEPVHRAMVAADFVVWASPLLLGNVSALLKKVQDRFVPMVHPYIEMRGGESHHRPRYAKDPDIGLIVGPGPEDGAEDLALVRELFRRFSRNSRGRFRLFATTATPIAEAVAAAIEGSPLGGEEEPAAWIAETAPAAPRSGATQRLLVNGSPRGRESNSRLLLSWIAEGMVGGGAAAGGPGAGPDAVPLLDLARATDPEERRRAVLAADEILLALPLYTDSVPGLVKGFLEELAALGPAALRGKRLALLVQSGFPESIHAEAVARWLVRASARLGFDHAGILIRGGVEGVRMQPPSMTRKTREAFQAAGSALAETGSFPPELARGIAGRRSFSALGVLLFRLLSLTGLANFYWDMMLKRHRAWERRFDAPYGQAYGS